MTRSITVLVSFPAPSATSVNPYTILLARHLENAGVTVRYFSWRAALLDDYDVFHVHWPENLVSGATVPRTWVRELLTIALLARLKRTKRALVRTVHNVDLPEGLSSIQRRILRRLDRQTDVVVRLNEFTPAPEAMAADVPVATIPHPDFREWFSSFSAQPVVRGQIGYVGRIRRYKGVETLIRAVKRAGASHGSTHPPLTARIAGYPSTAELASTLRELAGADANITLEFGFMSDARLVDIVTSSELVVLPYRSMHNSAAVLTALSLERPVLVPENAVTRALAEEVGDGWVHTFPGELRPDDIAHALTATRSRRRRSAPQFANRSWESVTNAHVEVFERARERARREDDE